MSLSSIIVGLCVALAACQAGCACGGLCLYHACMSPHASPLYAGWPAQGVDSEEACACSRQDPG